MKTTELMIGDLVYIYTFPNENPKQDDLMVAKLTCINSDEICNPPEPFCEGKIISSNGIFSRPIDTLIPIPLTAEILEKNGGVKDDIEDGYIINNSIGLWLENGEFEYASITIKYVHEYQHLLRLCNLNDLADNFKI